MNAPVPAPPRALFENLAREHGFEPVEVEGTLPERLCGTLFRNGAGQLQQFGRRYDHVFEADGAVSALRIRHGQASAAVRLVQSEGLVRERAAGRHLESFAASWPRRLRAIHRGPMKNTANTHVVPWQGRLYALMEGGRPTELDPDTLHTLGESDLGGIVGRAFSAHPHRVHGHRTTYNFGQVFGPRPALDLFALPDVGAARKLGRVPLQRPVMLHDFAVTERHAVFFVSPIRVVLWRMLIGLRSFTDNMRWCPQDGTEVLIVPLHDPERVFRFHTDPFACFHFASAFERGDGIVVDYVRYADANMLGALGNGLGLTWTDRQRHINGTLHRAYIDPNRRRLTSQPLWDGECEYPRHAPHEGGHAPSQHWMQSARYVDDVLRFAVTRVHFDGDATRVTHDNLDAGHLSSESVFAQDPEAAPGVGWLLTLVFDSRTERSHVLVHEAASLRRVARINLTQAIPLTFHGSWLPG